MAIKYLVNIHKKFVDKIIKIVPLFPKNTPLFPMEIPLFPFLCLIILLLEKNFQYLPLCFLWKVFISIKTNIFEFAVIASK